MRSRILPWLSLSFCFALGGCTSSQAPELAGENAAAPAAVDPTAFQASASWGHLEALAAIGPREAATEGAARARAYIAGELEALGLEVIEQAVSAKRANGDAVTLHNVLAAVPGESTDLVLVIAPYDTRGFDSFENLGVNDGGSGVAVNLELARLIAAKPLPYTTWFVFLEGEQEARGGIASAHLGSRGLAELLKERSAMQQVRLALLVNRVCDPDLHIARDLGSNRVYREEFFRTADRLGFGAAFDARAQFESPDEGQGVLADAGLSRVVVFTDTSFGGSEPPGPYADTADDDLEHCAAESLATVGQVALEGFQVMARRLRRIDRFATAPIAETEALRLEHLAETQSQAEPATETSAQPAVPGADAAPVPDADAAPVPDAEATPAPDADAAPAPDAEATPAPDADATPEAIDAAVPPEASEAAPAQAP